MITNRSSRGLLTVETTGGVGNQLFQFASGFGLARSHGLDLALDNTWYEARSLRRFELDLTHAQFIDRTQRGSMGVTRRRVRYRAELFNRGVAKTIFRQTEFEDAAGFNPSYQALLPRRISGYLQSWRYFDQAKDQIRSQISALRHPSDWYLAERERIRSGAYGRWLAVHVRHGDYLQPEYRSSVGLLDVDYYRAALTSLGSDQVWDTVVVFSDNERALDWLAGFSDIPTIRFDSDYRAPSIETLLLMSLSDGLICANSTFGWWAGWLHDRPGRPVAIPSPWFAASTADVQDYLVPGWIKVSRDGLRSAR